MNNLFKVILLCAILSNTFTPCFSNELNTFTEEIPHEGSLGEAVERLAELPMAVPEEIAKTEDKEVPAKLENGTSDFLMPEQKSVVPVVQYVQPIGEPDAVKNVMNDDNLILVDNSRVAACPIANDVLLNRTGTVKAFKEAYKCLEGRELTAVILEKGRKFDVKSVQSMSYKSTSESEIRFVSIYHERLFLNKDPVKLEFIGVIVKNKPPRKGGGSGTLKVKITGIKIENIVYPAEAYISKMNKKGVMFGAVAGPSKYKDNLTNTVNAGTINNYYGMDPCDKVANECVNNAVKPFYFITGAAMQTADLILAPIVAFFSPGNEIFIPEGTEFEIKLEGDVPVLDI